MKKFVLVLLVGLFPVALTYAQTNHEDLTRRVDSALANAQMGDPDDMEEPADEEEPASEILQRYVELCGGNEKLGKILYDVRKGKTPKANALGNYVLDTMEEEKALVKYDVYGRYKSHVTIKMRFDLALTGFLPFQTAEAINHYYPNGVWTIADGKITHIPGPLVGVLTGTMKSGGCRNNGFEFDRSTILERPRGWDGHRYPFGSWNTKGNFFYTVYNEENQQVFQKKKSDYRLSTSAKQIWKKPVIHYAKYKVHPMALINKLAPFDNEAAAQQALNEQQAEREKAQQKAQQKAERQQKRQERRQSFKELKEELFH